MKVFVDSSVLVEFVKGNDEAKRVLHKLSEVDAEVFINDIVFSEFVFHYISLKSGVSPLAVKEKRRIGEYLGEEEPFDFINQFGVLQVDEEVVRLSYKLMRKHNFLPNDAIILATCIRHSVDLLATLDGDFEDACKEEEVKVALKAEDLSG